MSEEKLSMNYVLEQMEKIMAETEYLHKTIEAIVTIEQGPGDMAGQSKAEALATVVQCRETTNQKMLTIYEKMYDDLKPQRPSGLTSDDRLRAVGMALGTIESIYTSVDVDEAMAESLNAVIDSIKQM